ncbi:Circadian clock protein kinase KaiC [uncultured archaeon]|nr:Circadian clock protein kinase KaiC [uncultured archaeon]
MERVKSGVIGLDELIGGGFPLGSTILLSGGAGTGKTIFGLTYLYEGAKKYGEPGLYITTEGNLKNLVWNMEVFGWDIKPLQDEGKLKIYNMKLHSQENVPRQISEELKAISILVKQMGCKRLVVDSTTALGVWIGESGQLRHLLYTFADALKELDCTTLLIAETKGGKNDFSAFGVEEFLVDGVIMLYFMPPNRSLFIRKMRGTNHSKTVHPFTISSLGLEVKPKDELLWDVLK